MVISYLKDTYPTFKNLNHNGRRKPKGLQLKVLPKFIQLNNLLKTRDKNNLPDIYFIQKSHQFVKYSHTHVYIAAPPPYHIKKGR